MGEGYQHFLADPPGASRCQQLSTTTIFPRPADRAGLQHLTPVCRGLTPLTR
jgi:hypothetical protein